MSSRLALAAFIIAIALGFFVIGLVWAREPVGALFGLLAGFGSAALWALGSVAGAPWNARLNLFAALSAAGSLEFLAPLDRLCGWHELTLLCR